MKDRFRISFGISLCALSLLLWACKDAEPTVDENLVAAYVEMRVAEQTYGESSPITRLIRRDVLKKYGYTRESFLEASEKILNETHYWMPFQNRVVDRVDSLLDPEGYVKKKAEELAKAKAKKSKNPPAKGEAKK